MSEDISEITRFNPDIVKINRENGFKDLSHQRKAFCITYVTNGYDHREAATEVGYSAATGVKLKREPLVAAYINFLQGQYLADSIVTKEVMDAKLDVLEDIAMGEQSIAMVTNMGENFIGKKFHPELAMKIYQERARLHNISKENDSKSLVNVTINMQGMVGESKPIIDAEIVDD